MKKVLVLMLVLGVASLASANYVPTVNGGLSVTVGKGGTVTLVVANNTAGVAGNLQQADDYVLFDTPGLVASVGGPTYGSAYLTGAPGWIDQTGSMAGLYELNNSLAANTAVPVGNIVTITLTMGNTQGTTNVTVYEGDLSTVDGNASITVTPEPATLAILGLGAMLLRRKK